MKFQFDLVDKLTPDKVVEKELNMIESLTRGYVIGKVESYEGHVFSYDYTKTTGLNTLTWYQKSGETVHVDIQTKLGEQNNEDKRFEVYLGVKGLNNYKYRMMFLKYGTLSYPATFVLNEDLAVVYGNGRKSTIVKLESMAEIQAMLDKILESEMMINLIQNLINEAIRQENKDMG